MFGSFVTVKLEPRDVGVPLFMADTFDATRWQSLCSLRRGKRERGAALAGWRMKFVFYAAIAFAVFVGLSLVSFWLAVRPPRLTVPLAKSLRLRKGAFGGRRRF